MSIVYRVDLESNTGQTVATFKNFVRLRYDIAVGDKGNYELVISGFDNRRLLFEPDSIIRVWMKDPSEGIEWTNTFNGIHKTYSDDLLENGNREFSSFGPDSNELIDKAEILYPATSAGAVKSGTATTIMYEYVSENVGADATTANGRNDNHVNPITNAPDLAQGPTWSGSEPWQELLTTLKKIREYSINQGDQVDFRTTYLGGYQWQFEAGKIGLDRTAVGLSPTSNGLNGAGNVPVIFGPAYGNVLTFIKSESRFNEANSITVIGQGEDLNRDAVTATDTLKATQSAIAKRERVINGNNIPLGDLTSLAVLALAKLDQYKSKEQYSFKPKRGAQILWRDFFPYDFVTGEDFDGNRVDRQIVGVSISVQATTNALIERTSIKFRDL